MNTKFAKDSFKGMPQWAKGAIGVAIVGTLIYLGYKILKAPKALKDGQGARQEDRAVNVELDKLISQGQSPKLSKAQLFGIANKLHTAMNGLGTDTGAMATAIMAIPTYADLLGVMSAYGNRTLNSGKWNPVPDFSGTLASAITEELDTAQVLTLNKILASKKINYRF